jgi:hypothetical protein
MAGKMVIFLYNNSGSKQRTKIKKNCNISREQLMFHTKDKKESDISIEQMFHTKDKRQEGV